MRLLRIENELKKYFFHFWAPLNFREIPKTNFQTTLWDIHLKFYFQKKKFLFLEVPLFGTKIRERNQKGTVYKM